MNKALRCINFISWKDKVNNNKVYFENKVLAIADMFQLELAKFMFSFKKGSLPLNFESYFKEIKLLHSYQTRSADSNFYIPRKLNRRGMHTISFMGAKLWSEISSVHKDKCNIKAFTYSYRQSLLQKYLK